MDIVIINSLGKNNFLKCFNSLKNTINIKKHKIHKFAEKKTRGHTLNSIIKKIGTKKNVVPSLQKTADGNQGLVNQNVPLPARVNRILGFGRLPAFKDLLKREKTPANGRGFNLNFPILKMDGRTLAFIKIMLERPGFI